MSSRQSDCPRGSSLLYHTLLFGLLAVTAQAGDFDGYYNKYCSSQNTGATYQAVYNTYNSMGSCATNCNNGNYAFAILQYKDCWCSNYIPATQLDTSQCSESCPGYPSDQCGDQAQGLFGYVALNASPLGTAGATTKKINPTPTPPPSPVSFITRTQTMDQTVVQTVTAVHTPTPSVVVSLVTPTLSPVSSPSPSSSPSPGSSTTVFTTSSASFIPTSTVSEAPTTHTVTARPSTVSPNPVTGGGDTLDEKHGLSAGATAGIVVGALIGAAAVILVGLLFWRRRKTDDSETGSNRSPRRSPRRKGSVLSRTGLLGGGGARPQSMSQPAYDDPFADGNMTRSNSIRHSMMFGAAASADGTHSSGPAGNPSSHDATSERRSSRPLVYDQRLNPSALFANHDNGSRVSMQDQQDYSRPLGVANPDFRYSFDSR